MTVSKSSTRIVAVAPDTVVFVVPPLSTQDRSSSTHPATVSSVTMYSVGIVVVDDGNTCILIDSPSFKEVLTAPLNGNKVVVSPSGSVSFLIIMVPLGVFLKVQTVSLPVRTVIPVMIFPAKLVTPVTVASCTISQERSTSFQPNGRSVSFTE